MFYMSSITNDLGNSVSFGGHVKENNGTLSVLWARLIEKVSKVNGNDPERSIASFSESQFALDLIRIEKTTARIELLNCMETFGPQVVVGKNVNLIYQAKRINRKLLFVADKKEAKELIDTSRVELSARLSTLYKKMVQWAKPQAKYGSPTQFYEKIVLIRGALTSCVKSGGDPTIPFLKAMIEERTKALLESANNDEKSTNELCSTLDQEIDFIFKQIPDMYYITFLGADHPKVQENLKNQNDLVKITPEDVKGHIVSLQLKAAVDFAKGSKQGVDKICERITLLYQNQTSKE